MTVSRTTLEKGTAFMSWDQEIDRTLSNSKRWQGRGDAIALTIGDSDFKLAQPIRRAILARLDEGVIGYDAVPTSLVELIVSRLHDRYGWVVDPDWLVFISGVVPGLNIAGRGLTGPEQVLVTEVPVYYPFLDVSENSNRRMIKLPAQAGSTRWEFDLDRLEAIAKTNNVGVLILCNPQNPLGRVLLPDELQAIGEICLRYDIIICSDEIHGDLVYEGNQHIPIASISPEINACSVTLMSPSKAFGISGIGGAFAVVSDPHIRDRFQSAAAGINMGLGSLPLVAMEAAYGECNSWFDEKLRYLQSNRDYLCEALLQIPGLRLTKPEGTYFLWIDFRDSGLNEPYTSLFDVGLELSNGDVFGDAGFLRLNFASPKPRLEKAMERLGSLFG